MREFSLAQKYAIIGLDGVGSIHSSAAKNVALRAVEAAKEPILFVCGLEDRSLPAGSTLKLRAARGDRDPILEVPGAKHALGWLRDPTAYAAALDGFIK